MTLLYFNSPFPPIAIECTYADDYFFVARHHVILCRLRAIHNELQGGQS
jgi:hypothetical protein